jgi:hypothetical protein
MRKGLQSLKVKKHLEHSWMQIICLGHQRNLVQNMCDGLNPNGLYSVIQLKFAKQNQCDSIQNCKVESN